MGSKSHVLQEGKKILEILSDQNHFNCIISSRITLKRRAVSTKPDFRKSDMRELTKEEKESLFPAECHFKVICMDLMGIHKNLNLALVEIGLEDIAFQPANRSKKGKYISFEVSLMVETHDRMLEIDQAIRSVEGVKMLL
jgi:putative lipoic acid-binding regulatory protein